MLYYEMTDDFFVKFIKFKNLKQKKYGTLKNDRRRD